MLPRVEHVATALMSTLGDLRVIRRHHRFVRRAGESITHATAEASNDRGRSCCVVVTSYMQCFPRALNRLEISTSRCNVTLRRSVEISRSDYWLLEVYFSYSGKGSGWVILPPTDYHIMPSWSINRSK